MKELGRLIAMKCHCSSNVDTNRRTPRNGRLQGGP